LGRTLQFEFIYRTILEKLIVGLDNYDLKDYIIFHDITFNFEFRKKKLN